MLRLRGYDQNSGNCKVGQTLVIRREHSNPKDEFAVAVMDLESWRVVGPMGTIGNMFITFVMFEVNMLTHQFRIT